MEKGEVEMVPDKGQRKGSLTLNYARSATQAHVANQKVWVGNRKLVQIPDFAKLPFSTELT